MSPAPIPAAATVASMNLRNIFISLSAAAEGPAGWRCLKPGRLNGRGRKRLAAVDQHGGTEATTDQA
jgi:hypothetical protein